MKHVISLLSFAIMVSISLSSAMAQGGSGGGGGVIFPISNRQSDALGTVTINCSGTYYATVPGMTDTAVTIPDSATSIVINGTSVPAGQKAYLYLASGKEVEVVWDDGGPIVIDPDEILMRESDTERLLAELRARAGDWAIMHREFYMIT